MVANIFPADSNPPPTPMTLGDRVKRSNWLGKNIPVAVTYRRPRLKDNFITLQKKTAAYFIFILIMSTSLIGLSVTAQKGDHTREKFGSVGVIYLEWKTRLLHIRR